MPVGRGGLRGASGGVGGGARHARARARARRGAERRDRERPGRRRRGRGHRRRGRGRGRSILRCARARRRIRPGELPRPVVRPAERARPQQGDAGRKAQRRSPPRLQPRGHDRHRLRVRLRPRVRVRLRLRLRLRARAPPPPSFTARSRAAAISGVTVPAASSVFATGAGVVEASAESSVRSGARAGVFAATGPGASAISSVALGRRCGHRLGRRSRGHRRPIGLGIALLRRRRNGGQEIDLRDHCRAVAPARLVVAAVVSDVCAETSPSNRTVSRDRNLGGGRLDRRDLARLARARPRRRRAAHRTSRDRVLERDRNLLHRREAVLRRVRHRPRHHLRDRARYLRYQRIEEGNLDRPREHAAGMLARDELVGGEPVGVLIGARVDLRTGELLRCHVPRRAEHVSCLRAEAHRREGLREAEIEHLHDAVVGDHHVGGLHVTMDDACLVRRPERARRVDEPRELARDRHSIVADVREQRHPRDELHHDVEDALGLPDVVDGDGVRMREHRRRPRLAEEARYRLGVVAIGTKDLQRHLAP